MSNIELAAKYRKQLYEYLLNDYYVGTLDNEVHQSNKRNEVRDIIVIDAYTQAINNLGLVPDTQEVIQEASHDNRALRFRLGGGRQTLLWLYYKEFKAVTHVIENKNNYIGEEIDCKDFECKGVKKIKGKVVGIGKNSICVIDSEEHKEFFWYLPPPLFANDANGYGVELSKYLIDLYGE